MKSPNQPLVSVLVPVYQAEKYIERCARSLFEQTYDNLEYVFCDDCSTDASIQILEEVLKEYPERTAQVQIIHHEQNRGLASARNTLIANSKGLFLFWVDSDDWVEKNAIALLVAKQQETDADIVTGRAIAHMKDKTTRCHDGWDLDKNSLMEEIIKCKCGSTLWRRLFRKSLFIDNDIHFLDGVAGREDYAVVIPLLYYSKIVAGLDAIVYHWNRTNLNSISYGYKDLTFQRGYLLSCEVVALFFEGKDDRYYLCKKMMVKRAHDFMMIHYRHRYSEGYKAMVEWIMESEKQYWNVIRWNLWIVRMVERNYLMMLLSQPVRSIYSKLFL